MAKATKQVVMTETLTGVTLELSVQEARTLAVILRHVGGHPETTRRGDAQSISAALEGAGVASKHPHDWLDSIVRSIHFTDASLENSHD